MSIGSLFLPSQTFTILYDLIIGFEFFSSRIWFCWSYSHTQKTIIQDSLLNNKSRYFEYKQTHLLDIIASRYLQYGYVYIEFCALSKYLPLFLGLFFLIIGGDLLKTLVIVMQMASWSEAK